MAKVIVIKGDPNVGKTTASRYVLESLLLMGANLIMYQSANSSPKTQLDGDFEAKVEIAGKTVAVCSQGDVLKWVLNNIKKYIACDVVVVTSRNFSTFNKTINNVYNPVVFGKQLVNASLVAGYMDLAHFVRQVVTEILKP